MGGDWESRGVWLVPTAVGSCGLNTSCTIPRTSLDSEVELLHVVFVPQLSCGVQLHVQELKLLIACNIEQVSVRVTEDRVIVEREVVCKL